MVIVMRTAAAFALVVCLALSGICLGLAYPSQVLAWDNCPKELVNDPYPGECRRYVDTNGDGICDLSQSEPSKSTPTATAGKPETTTTTTPAVATAASGEPPTGGCPLGPCVGCGACLSIGVALASTDATEAVSLSTGSPDTTAPATAAGTPALSAAGGLADMTTAPSGSPSFFTGYNVSPIALGLLLVYGVSFVLHKARRIGVTTHRKVWNVLLLATFMITGIFGLILTVQLDYQLPFSIPFNLLFWHVEAGVSMTLISFFHVGWHFNYYRNLLRSGRRRMSTTRVAEQGPWPEQAPVLEQTQECGPIRQLTPSPRPGAGPQADLSSSPHFPPLGRLEPETD